MLVKGTVAVEPGTVTSVALLGGAGERRELYAFGDAAGSWAAPAGGIRTGAGGTAPSSPTVSTPAGARPGEALPLPSRWGSTLAPIALLVALLAVAAAMWRHGWA